MEAVLERPRTFSRQFQMAHQEPDQELRMRMSEGESWKAYMLRAQDAGKISRPHEVMARSARRYMEPHFEWGMAGLPPVAPARHGGQGRPAAPAPVLRSPDGGMNGAFRTMHKTAVQRMRERRDRLIAEKQRALEEKQQKQKEAQNLLDRKRQEIEQAMWVKAEIRPFPESPNLKEEVLASSAKEATVEPVVPVIDTPVPLPSLPLETILNLLPWLETQIPGATVTITDATIVRQDRELASVTFRHPDPLVGVVEYDLPRKDMPEGASSGDGISLLLLKMPDGVWESPDVIRTRLEGHRPVPNLRPAALDRWNDPERPLPEGRLMDEHEVQTYEEQVAEHHRRWDAREHEAQKQPHGAGEPAAGSGAHAD